MKKALLLTGLGIALATSALAFAAVNSVNLQFSPKVGDKFKFKMTGKLEILGSSAEVTADIECGITKVDNDRSYTMTSSQTNMIAVVEGESINLPDSFYSTVNQANGELIDLKTETTDPTTWRMMQLKHFVYPPKLVDVGDEWTSSVTPDPKRGTVTAKSIFKLESLEKIERRDTAKVRVTYEEKEGTVPASSDGYVWIDVSDGSIVRSQTTWRNVPTPQGPVNGKVTIERV